MDTNTLERAADEIKVFYNN